MISKCIIRQIDSNTWSILAPEFLDYNYRQTWSFGTASAKRVHAISEHIAIEQTEQRLVALADVRIKKLPVIGGGLAYINGGPLVWKKDVNEEDVFSAVIEALMQEYVIRRKFILRIAPPINGGLGKNTLEKFLVHNGFVKMPQEKKTILVDLCLDEATIRANFHQKWRNCLNRSEKIGLTVRTGSDYATFQEFIPLFNELITKKQFKVDLGIDFYASVQKAATFGQNFLIILAEYKGKVVAGHVASLLGDTCVYLLGAADKTGREMNAAYLLQWTAILLGKAAGCRWYDLGGIDSQNNPGVYMFKNRMGGQERILPGPYQLKPDGIRALLTQLGEKFYAFSKPFLIRS